MPADLLGGVVIPAQPGFTLVRATLPCTRDAQDIRYDLDAVIAFRVGHGGAFCGPMPITMSGEPSKTCGQRWTVRQQNGRCTGPGGDHENFQLFKAYCRDELARLPEEAA